MTRIYISHFPEDTSRNEVPVIREHLGQAFGQDNIFDSTGSGMETTTDRQNVVQSCDLLMVVIGNYWGNMVDENGNRLIEDVYDAVHVEIDAGLRGSIKTVVFLVDAVEIPDVNQIPEPLRLILSKGEVKISDSDQLDRALKKLIRLLSETPIKQIERETMRPTVLPVSPKLVRVRNEIGSGTRHRRLPRVYISHFQGDTCINQVQVIRDGFVNELGRNNVYDSSRMFYLGTTQKVRLCDVLVVVIGQKWSRENIWIQEEIKAALENSMQVFVLLMDGASLPQITQSPHALDPLHDKNIFEVVATDRPSQVLNELISEISTNWVEDVDRPRQHAPAERVHRNRQSTPRSNSVTNHGQSPNDIDFLFE